MKVHVVGGNADTVWVNPDHVVCALERVRNDILVTDLFLSDGQSITVPGSEELVLTLLGFNLNP